MVVGFKIIILTKIKNNRRKETEVFLDIAVFIYGLLFSFENDHMLEFTSNHENVPSKASVPFIFISLCDIV